jgi:hypothetical protein
MTIPADDELFVADTATPAVCKGEKNVARPPE